MCIFLSILCMCICEEGGDNGCDQLSRLNKSGRKPASWSRRVRDLAKFIKIYPLRPKKIKKSKCKKGQHWFKERFPRINVMHGSDKQIVVRHDL